MPLRSLAFPEVGPMPADAAMTLAILEQALDALVPGRLLDRNLLVATWNIRQLGAFLGRWDTRPADSPKRNLADLHYIAEIISRFDVIAVQETRDDLAALRLIMQLLGPDWGLLLSDVTHGTKGNQERLGYIFDLRRARPSGLVGELVASPEDLKELHDMRLSHPLASDSTKGKTAKEIAAIELERDFGGQLDRTPYLASFNTAGRPFMLATVHLVFGAEGDLDRRADEAGLLAKLLARSIVTAKKGPPDEFRANLIALGDFNATKAGDPILAALTAQGMTTATELADCRRTTGTGRDAFDQFAWFTAPGALNFPRVSGNSFPWDDHILADAASNTFRISDHYPLWLELSVAHG